jgi:hypothetical protein
MSSWENFPRDVRLLILKTVCLEAIGSFKSLRKTIEDETEPDFLDASSELRYQATRAGKRGKGRWRSYQWPPGPTALKTYFSVINTCREFHNVVMNEIRFDGLSTRNILLEQQRDNVHWYAKQPTAVAHCLFYHELAGRFWKNPLVIDDIKLILQVLNTMPYHSNRYWPPLIEDWLMRHAKNAPPNPFSGKQYDGWDPKHDGWVECLMTICDTKETYGDLDLKYVWFKPYHCQRSFLRS